MSLSIIIPTLNEAAHVGDAIASLPDGAEVIVADGGSTDETAGIASRSGARVVSSGPGRAEQMNSGARAATREVLLFLHADCTLGVHAGEAIAAALEDPNVVGGSFRLEIRNADASLKLIASASNARARFLGAPYGDQALFVRRKIFEDIGGYPNLPFMEDVALVRNLRRVGTLVRLDETVTTGNRHWERLGPFATTLLNWAMVSLFLLGVRAERLAPIYGRLRGNRASSKPRKALNPS